MSTPPSPFRLTTDVPTTQPDELRIPPPSPEYLRSVIYQIGSLARLEAYPAQSAVPANSEVK
jgi:hypothetical protein